jgi:hypothetical protein
LVDVALLKQLESGFEALTRFKALSKEFAQDAKGKKKAAIRVAAASAAGDEGRGVGAFARTAVGGGAGGGNGQQQQAWQDQQTSGFSSAARPSSSAQMDVSLSALRLYGSSAPPSHGPSNAASALGSPALAASPAQAKHRLPFADLDDAATAAPTSATPSLLTQLTVHDGGLGGSDEHGHEEAKRTHVLQLDMRAHADPAAQLSDVGLASHGGEVVRIYQSGGGGGGLSSSALPWWSSAVTAIPPAGATSGAASFADATHVDRRAESSALDGGRGAQKAARYQPKPPAFAKRA